MKLIEADKVAKNVYDRIEKDLCWNTSPYNCDELEVCLPKEDYEYLRGLNEAQDCAVKTINEEPTVDAIPIEWLEKWFTEKYKRTIVWWDYAEVVFKTFMEDWEAENE